MIARSQDIPVDSHPLGHVDDYLEVGQKAGASDVHLAVNAQPRWRLHGTLQPIWPDAPRLTAEQTAALAEKFVPNVYKEELNNRGDSDFAYANEFARYRTSVVRQRLGIEIVFRVINSKVRTMDELELPEHLKLLTRYQNGLVLVTGSVGTGKSTTLAAMVEQIIHSKIEKLPCYPAGNIHPYRLFWRGSARFAPRGSGRDHGWRNARLGNNFLGHHRLRNRSSCFGNAAYQ